MKQNDTLIIKYLTGSASFEEQAVLLKWLEESETNRGHFRSMKDAYDSGRLKYEQKNSHVQSQWDMFRKNISVNRPADKRLLNRFAWMRYVAVLILGIPIGLLDSLHSGRKIGVPRGSNPYRDRGWR